MLYECLTGTPAFRRESEAETLWAHMQGRYAPVAGARARVQAGVRARPEGSLRKLSRADRGGARAHAGARTARAGSARRWRRSRRRRRPRRCIVGDGDVEALPPGSFVVALDADGGIGSFTEAATAPSNIAVGEGAVWVLDSEAETVARLDPATQAVKRFSAGPRPTDLAVGGGAVWVGNGAGSESFARGSRPASRASIRAA